MMLRQRRSCNDSNRRRSPLTPSAVSRTNFRILNQPHPRPQRFHVFDKSLPQRDLGTLYDSIEGNTLISGERKAMKILGVIRVRNSARYIRACIESQPFCDKILVFNDYSTDGTIEICREFPQVEIVDSPWPSDPANFAHGRDQQFLAEWAGRVWRNSPPQTDKWICSLDADEVFERNARDKIRPHLENPSVVCIEAQALHLWDNENTLRVDGHFGWGYR
jgi:hypothetical protein